MSYSNDFAPLFFNFHLFTLFLLYLLAQFFLGGRNALACIGFFIITILATPITTTFTVCSDLFHD